MARYVHFPRECNVNKNVCPLQSHKTCVLSPPKKINKNPIDHVLVHHLDQ